MASSSTITQTTVYLPTILLDETNYPSWLFRVEAFLKGQNLYGLVDGSVPCPPQFIQSSDGINVISPEYEAWKTQDQSVVNMLGQTLSPVAINCVVGSRSAYEMWRNLKLKFASSNRQNIVQLKTNLQNVKKGADNIETYLDRIKAARDALETVGVFLDDEDIVVTVLRGLPSDFAAIKTVIRAQFVNSTLHELKSLLQAAEIDIELESQETTGPLTAMVAKSSSPTVYAAHTLTSSALTSPSCSSSSSQSSATVTPTIPPGFASPAVGAMPQSPPSPYASIPTLPYGFGAMPQSPPSPYAPIPTLPYGFGAFNPYAMVNPMQLGTMTGFYAGRNGGSGNNNNFQQGNRGPNNNFHRRSGDNYGGSNYGVNSGFGRNNAGGNAGSSFTCQLCGRVGHGAKTCRSLSNFKQGNTSTDITCQYCGKDNHTADRCFHIIGFPGQQQQQNSITHQATAMLATNQYAPQYWLADSGATNHMTCDAQMLSNITPISISDSVQVGNGAQLPVTHFGQGAGQNSVQRTE